MNAQDGMTYKDAIAWIRTRDISSDEHHKAVRFIVDLITVQQRQLAESEAGAAVMREYIEREVGCKDLCNQCEAVDCMYLKVKQGTAGAPLLAEVERLRKQVQDMRNCENCTYRHGRHAQCDKCQTMELEGWKWRGEGE